MVRMGDRGGNRKLQDGATTLGAKGECQVPKDQGEGPGVVRKVGADFWENTVTKLGPEGGAAGEGATETERSPGGKAQVP